MTEGTLDVFGWLADRQGCGTIRVMQPLTALADETGLNTDFNEAMQTKGFMPKVILGQRICKDAPSRLWQTIAEQSTRPKLVFELDDDLWNIDPTNEIAYAWFINGFDVRSEETHDVANNLRMNIEMADRVTCTTQALADIVGQWNDDVRIVPNYIPRWMTERERTPNEKLTIGWLGSATHNMDWDTASSQIRRFLERNKEVQFRLMGADYADWLKLPEDQVEQTGWFHNVDDCWKAINFDIGIAPLRPHIFNRSKSAIKFLEYASLGIPTVASDVGPYADNIVHGETGFLVKYEHEWSKYLRMLTQDHAMREEIGSNAREWAKTQTLEGNIDSWKVALGEW